MLNKFIVSLVLASFLLAPSVSVADPLGLPLAPPLQPNEQPVGEVISPLKQGQHASFTGLLLSPAAVAKIVVQLNNEQAQRDIEVKKAQDTQKALDQLVINDLNSQLAYLKTTTDAEVKSRDEQIKTITKKLQDVENNKSNPMLWAGLGTVGGVVLSVVTIFAVSHATR